MNSPQAKHNIDNCDPKTHIIIKGARVHNLKGVDVAIPRNQLVVITGLSGSGSLPWPLTPCLRRAKECT